MPPLVEAASSSEAVQRDPSCLHRVVNMCAFAMRTVTGGIDDLRQGVHEVIHGEYSEKFKQEMRQRNRFETSDGVRLTARIFNPEYLDNDEPAIVYSFSLVVPGNHGAEIPTVADIAAHSETTGRAVIAITSDGLAGALGAEQLSSLADFWKISQRRYAVLRQILKPGKEVIFAGASLGGMLSEALAATAEEEAQLSGHPLIPTHVISVAAPGHHQLSLTDLPKIGKQFVVDEPIASFKYAAGGKGLKGKAQRLCELAGTIPRHPAQYAAIAMTGVGILRAPLQGVYWRIPPSVKLDVITFSEDGVTRSHKRSELIAQSNHPNASHSTHEGYNHVDGLLTVGREETLASLESIPVKNPLAKTLHT